ncbi:glycosyltransferase [Puia sp.]|jgi:dolichyl-phosphate beta-glucosyltransferase|uniref:glycosyltransferase n=1 Tax=Puia sp. TaxID=2045100 RepID=UPI002F3F077C
MISFILPVYNCYAEFAALLPVFVRGLEEGGEAWEVIVVDDGSWDGESIREAAIGNGCSYLRNERNRGKGYAVRRGFGVACGEVQIFMDGDFPFYPEVAGRMIRAFADGQMDIVVGDRSLAESVYPKDIGAMRKWGSRVLSFFVGNFFTPGFFDTQCGIKGFRRAVAAQLFPVMQVDGFALDLELLYVAIRRGYVIGRIPVGTRKQGSSSVRVVRDALGTVGSILLIWVNRMRGRYRV